MLDAIDYNPEERAAQIALAYDDVVPLLEPVLSEDEASGWAMHAYGEGIPVTNGQEAGYLAREIRGYESGLWAVMARDGKPRVDHGGATAWAEYELEYGEVPTGEEMCAPIDPVGAAASKIVGLVMDVATHVGYAITHLDDVIEPEEFEKLSPEDQDAIVECARADDIDVSSMTDNPDLVDADMP